MKQTLGFTPWYRWFFLLYIALIAGCGFALRGSFVIAPEFTPVYVQSETNSQISEEIKQNLKVNAIPYTEDFKAAKLLIHITKEFHTNRVAAVNSYGKVISSELHFLVVFDVMRNDGRYLIENERMDIARDYVNPEVEVLGKSEEADIIQRDMVQDMADRILRRLRQKLIAS